MTRCASTKLVKVLDRRCNTHTFECNGVFLAADIGAAFLFTL
jgi:hypothetical protein